MKNFFVSLVISALCLLFILSGTGNAGAQDPVNQASQGSHTQTSQELSEEKSLESFNNKSQQLDLKLQLLDTKLDLLDSKIKLWEAKPEELDIRLKEIDERINSLAFNPDELNDQFFKIDSLIAELKETQIQTKSAQTDISQPDLFFREEISKPEFKSAIMLDPVRLFEGTFCISYERLITDKFSLGVSGLATYATEDGMTNYFFANQKLAYFDEVSDSYIDYQGESIAGGGIILQCREYLLANYQTRRRPPAGLYAAPQILYRRLLITGEEMEFIEDEWVTKVVKQRLNILSTGVIIGVRVPFKKVLFVDFFLGGQIKFSKYDGEAGLTKYKESFNIDFSGVFPTAGIGIGILK